MISVATKPTANVAAAAATTQPSDSKDWVITRADKHASGHRAQGPAMAASRRLAAQVHEECHDNPEKVTA